LDLIEFLRAEAQEGQRMLDIALTDLEEGVANWQPPGTANSIAQLLAHVVTGQDRAVNLVLKGGQPVFQAGSWAAATGIPEERGAIWRKDWRLNVASFCEYRAAVRESLEDYLSSIDLGTLEREFPWAGGNQSGWWLARTIFINHVLGHAGEISTLKGLQGLKGLPF
jgi:hypothetical protein